MKVEGNGWGGIIYKPGTRLSKKNQHKIMNDNIVFILCVGATGNKWQ